MDWLSGSKQRLLSDAIKHKAQPLAMFLAMAVRNGMENFHARHLSDEQMRELNPLIRNAIYTGLRALEDCQRSEAAAKFVAFTTALVPSYWEPAEVLCEEAGHPRGSMPKGTRKMRKGKKKRSKFLPKAVCAAYVASYNRSDGEAIRAKLESQYPEEFENMKALDSPHDD